MWDSDVDFDLAAFHSLVRALKRPLVIVLVMFLNVFGYCTSCISWCIYALMFFFDKC